MPAERIDLRNFKRAALAAPVLLFAAHFGCSTKDQKKPPPTPAQTSGQQPNPITTPTPFTEQFGGDNQPTNTQTPQKTAIRMSISTPTSEIPTQELDSNGHLVFKEKGYTYSLYPDMTLATLLGQTKTGEPNNWDSLQFLKESGYIKPQAADDIRSLLTAVKQKELVNPQDPAIIKGVNSAANVLDAHCNNDTYLKGYMKVLASYVYHKNPQDWQNSKRIYLDGSCFWGEKK